MTGKGLLHFKDTPVFKLFDSVSQAPTSNKNRNIIAIFTETSKN
jgi:hypothetical protein